MYAVGCLSSARTDLSSSSEMSSAEFLLTSAYLSSMSS